jgi:glycosyltransferase involved in cell wall biosynthesis
VNAGETYMQASSGRVADELAKHYRKLLICTRVVYGPPPSPADLPLEAPNLELIAQPFWRTSLSSLPHFFGIFRAYLRTCRESDVIFIRGMCPYIGVLYLCAFAFQRPVCHWIVGNPVALLRTSTRRGKLLDTFALLYALQDRILCRVGRWLTNGVFLCNGRELAEAYRSTRTVATVSSALREDEFIHRSDTCQGAKIRILFVGYIRPEKGIEYLLDAVSRLVIPQPWELTSWDRAIFHSIVAGSIPSLHLAVSGSECFGPGIPRTVSRYLTIWARPIFSYCPACPKAHRTCWSRGGPPVCHAFRLLSEACPARSQTDMTPCSSLRRAQTPWPGQWNG